MPRRPLVFTTTLVPAIGLPLMPAINVRVLVSLSADADRVGLAGNTLVADIDIVIARGEIFTGINAQARCCCCRWCC